MKIIAVVLLGLLCGQGQITVLLPPALLNHVALLDKGGAR